MKYLALVAIAIAIAVASLVGCASQNPAANWRGRILQKYA